MQGWACERENADQAPHTHTLLSMAGPDPILGKLPGPGLSCLGVFASLVPRATTAAPGMLKLTPSHNLTLLITHRLRSTIQRRVTRSIKFTSVSSVAQPQSCILLALRLEHHTTRITHDHDGVITSCALHWLF